MENQKTNIKDLLTEDVIREIEERHPKFKPIYWRVMIGFLEGMKHIRIAESLGIHQNSVGRLWNDPVYRSVFNELNSKRNLKAIENFSKVREALDTNSVLAEQVLVDLMLDEDTAANVRSSNAREILHMAGHKPKERLEVVSNNEVVIVTKDPDYNPDDDPYVQNKKLLGLISPVDEAKEAEYVKDLETLTEMDSNKMDSNG